MKKVLVTLLFLFYAWSACAVEVSNYERPESTICEELNVSASKSIPLDVEEIILCDEGIFALVNGTYTELSSISHNGSHFIGKLRAYLGWKCPQCGYDNGSFANVCGGCGYRPHAPKSK